MITIIKNMKKFDFTLTDTVWQQLLDLSFRQNKVLNGGLYLHIQDLNFYILDFRNYNIRTESIERLKITINDNSMEIKLDIMGTVFNVFNKIENSGFLTIHSFFDNLEIENITAQLNQYSASVKAFDFAQNSFSKVIKLFTKEK